MALFSVENVRIAGVSSCVPKNTIENKNSTLFDDVDELNKYINSTGVERRHVADKSVCSSDLCYEAAERIIEELGWSKDSIDCLAFVSQTGDYIYPATACILQDRLQLKTTCMSFDITMGCTGWVYGMSIISSMMQNGAIKRALLLNGETVSKTRSPHDRVNMITGDAGTATALEYKIGAPAMHYDLNTDGSGYETIIIPDGGYRNMVTQNSLVERVQDDGVIRNNLHTKMDGAGVFAFAISKAPKSINQLKSNFNIPDDDVDFYLLHQANRLIIDKIQKKLRVEGESKVPCCLNDFGNTSSTSIPLLITSRLHDVFCKKHCIACAFGVGLSWASVYFETDEAIVCPELIQI